MKKSFKLTFLIVLTVLLMSLVSCELSTAEPSKGTLRVFAYGSNYNNTKYDACINDAVDFVNAMKLLKEKSDTYSGFEVLGPYNTADKTFFEDKLSGITASDNDTFVFFYSGHGYSDSQYETDQYGADTSAYTYICPDQASDKTGYIRLSDLKALISEIKGRKIIILDSCFSGGINLADGITVSQTVWPDKNVNVFNLYNNSNDETLSSDMEVLTAARYYEESVISHTSDRNSDCTAVILKAMGYDYSSESISSIPAQNGKYLTVQGIYNYLKKNYDGKTDNGKTYIYSTSTGGSLDLVLFQF